MTVISKENLYREASEMRKIVPSTSLMLFRNITRIKNRIRPYVGQAHKADITQLESSYYIHEAQALGVQASILDNNVLQLRRNGAVQNIYRAFTDLDGEGTLMIAGDKVFCSSMLRRHGIPIPESVVLKSGDHRGAAEFRRRIGAPIVIKPAKNTGDSKGVFIRPDSGFAIWRAVNLAGQFGNEILAERFHEGTNYRLLFCRGKFLAASSRNPARVVGDGIHTVRELIHRANAGRLPTAREITAYDPATRPILYRIPVTGELRALVKRQGFSMNSIPQEGKVVMLQDICHWLYGGEYLDVTDEVSPDFIELGKKVVDILGIKLAGIDLIAQDIRVARPGKFFVNEVNTSPALLVHYEVQNRREMRPVAREIIRSMFS